MRNHQESYVSTHGVATESLVRKAVKKKLIPYAIHIVLFNLAIYQCTTRTVKHIFVACPPGVQVQGKTSPSLHHLYLLDAQTIMFTTAMQLSLSYNYYCKQQQQKSVVY